MDAPLFVGVDVGTSGVKVGVVDVRGEILALTAAPCPVERPRPGFVEQDPDDYWTVVVRCVREALAAPGVDARRVTALSSCGHAPTLVLLDSEGRPVRPAILWQDTRAAKEAEALANEPGAERLAEWLGVRWPVDASLPAARFLWLRRHEPAALARVTKVLLPKDYVHLRLTGEASTDAWSGKGLVNQQTLQPIEPLFALAGLRSDVAPRALAASAAVGRVHAEGAAATGLPEGIPVVAGWTDAMAAMLGTGALGEAGLACDVSGTSEVIGLTAAARPADTGPLMAADILASGRWMVYGPTQASGGSLGWILRTLGLEGDAVGALERAAMAPAGADGLVFLPYLQGERAPLWDPRARGGLVGLTTAHGAEHLVRAVLEGVACSVWHVLSSAEGAVGETTREVRVAGGGARMAVWNRIKASIAGRRFRPCATAENGVLGAAMLAVLGSGVYADAAEAGRAMVRLEEPVEPDVEVAGVYQRLFERYVALWPRIAEIARGN
ncbi:MAG TPA: FGGY family carbohydrate kinase [Chloroflexota bacterium]|nr:FGGY family carbohydrate kinase [Chloroflexota bacterium]